MTTLKELFAARDKAYTKATREILKTIPDTIAAIVQFSELAEEYAKGRLTWEEASIVHENGTEFVLLVGLLGYIVGDKIETPNGTLEVTQQTADNFQRLVRVGVPVEIAETNDPEKVVEYLQLAAEENEQEMEELQTAFREQHANQQVADFDLDELTEEQREALMLHLRGQTS